MYLKCPCPSTVVNIRTLHRLFRIFVPALVGSDSEGAQKALETFSKVSAIVSILLLTHTHILKSQCHSMFTICKPLCADFLECPRN